jgi:uncharacterized protein YydD (DUF2326 family)
MIHAVRANQPSFKTVEFTHGFNVVLADRTKESTKKETRNGLGKSTLLEIIHFCLGAGATARQGLLVDTLAGWEFALDLTLQGEQISVARSTTTPAKVYIIGNTATWPIQPWYDNKNDRFTLEVKEWNKILGHLLFGLPVTTEVEYRPTFRSLLSYFIRRGRDAFSTPFEHHRKQHEWDKQVHNAYLLELAWEDASAWQILKDKRKTISELQKATSQGMIGEVVGSRGQLEATKVQLEAKARQERENLQSFLVHPQYREIEEQANQLTQAIHHDANSNIADTQLLTLYRTSIEQEQEPAQGEVTRLYEEAGIALPGLVQRRLAEVQAFHSQIIINRRQFLAAEIDRLTRVIAERTEAIAQKTGRRASYMQTLQTYGALEEYMELQQLHLNTEAQIRDIDHRIGNLRRLEEGQSELRLEQELLQRRARHDYDERKAQRERSIALFNANSEALYDAPGRLIIDIGPNGFQFGVEIERSGSQGISSMKVFCYDIMLAQLWSSKEPSPAFLIHDSTIFDGVDERQIALALQLAARMSAEYGFQYICTLNSDTIPWAEFDPDFDLNAFVRLRLTDETSSGGLLGIRF